MRATAVGVIGALALAACSGGGTTAHVSIELATSPAPGAAFDGCTMTDEPSLPASLTCIGVTLCAVGATGGCTPVPLAHPGMPHIAPFATELRIDRATMSGALEFDAMARPGRYTLRLTAYDTAGHVSAVGSASGFYLAESGTSVVVRLERVGRWSCGPQTAMGPVAPRALGAAVALPNGDVMLLGGVQGIVDELGFRAGAPTGATLQRTVEIFDAQTQRVRTVIDPAMGLGRVLFAAVAAPDAPDAAAYHVYVYGGYEVSGGSSVLLLDANQAGTPVGTPVVPTTDARPGSPVMITYTPATGVATISDLMLPSVPNAGFDAVSDYVSGNAFLVLGTGAFVGMPESTTYLKQAYILGPDGRLATGLGSINLAGGRLGATVTGFGSTTALIFGGSTAEAMAQGARNLTAEVINSTGAPTSVSGGGLPYACGGTPMHTPTEVPDPVAFHTATPVAGGVLLAGGMLVGGADCPGRGVTTQLNPRPLVFLSVPPSLTGLRGIDVPAATTPFTSVLFHTATALTAEEGAAGGVLLVGGATRVPPTTFVLEPSAQVGIVTPVPGGASPFQYVAAPSLAIARWGHAAARIPGGRVLVAGGFAHADPAVDGTPRLRALDSLEVLPLAPPPAAIPGGLCQDVLMSGGDGGAADAGAMDSGPRDAGAVDSGPPPADAATGG